MLIVDKNGDFSVRVDRADDDPEAVGAELVAQGVLHTFEFGPELVRDGVAVEFDPDFNVIATHDTRREPRTAIGQIGPLHYVVIVADGRQDGYSRGLTLQELQQIFVRYGAQTAMNLDGGGTAEMWLCGEILNRPSGGRERSMSDIIWYSRALRKMARRGLNRPRRRCGAGTCDCACDVDHPQHGLLFALPSSSPERVGGEINAVLWQTGLCALLCGISAFVPCFSATAACPRAAAGCSSACRCLFAYCSSCFCICYDGGVVVIPALQPDQRLVSYARLLLARGFARLVVVDDGSWAGSRRHLRRRGRPAGATVLRHAVNRGKGAALKTGVCAPAGNARPARRHRHCRLRRPARRGRCGKCRPLPRRTFARPRARTRHARFWQGPTCPSRAAPETRITSVCFRLACGVKLPDTQTGLRAFSAELLPENARYRGRAL